MRRWVGVVPVTLLGVLTLVAGVLGWRMWTPPVPGLTPEMLRRIDRFGPGLTVVDGDPEVARKIWLRWGGDDPVHTDVNGCRPQLLAVSYVGYGPDISRENGSWWAVYSTGFYQPNFGGSGGGFCADSFALLNPHTLRWETIETF